MLFLMAKFGGSLKEMVEQNHYYSVTTVTEAH